MVLLSHLDLINWINRGRNTYMHFLPYGSVVTVKDKEYPIMIVDWTPKIYKKDAKHVAILKKMLFNDLENMIDNATREFTLHDYLGCPWPSGYILDEEEPYDKEKAITRVPFNHEDIESVLFIGPFNEIFIKHDQVSFEFACENKMRIADFYNKGQAQEFEVQDLKNSRSEPIQVSEDLQPEALLPIGSVVVKEFSYEETTANLNMMICSVGAPFYPSKPEYEVFDWESGSVLLDDMDLAIDHLDYLEVKSLGYVNAEVQLFLSNVSEHRDDFPTLDEIMQKNDEFKI